MHCTFFIRHTILATELQHKHRTFAVVNKEKYKLVTPWKKKPVLF